MSVAPPLFSDLPQTWCCPVHGEYSNSTDFTGPRQFTCPDCFREGEAAFNAWRHAWDLHRRWLGSGIPERYRNRTFGNFRSLPSNVTAIAIVRRFAESFAQHRTRGIGLLLTGDVGCGKTHLAAAALTEILRRDARGAFLTAREFFASLKRGRGGKAIDVDALARVDCLVLDDVGAAGGTARDACALADLLSARYDASLPTVLTTNVRDLAPFIGDRAVDRFTESMLVAHLEGDSFRGRAAEDFDLQRAPPAIPTPPMEFTTERTTAGKPCCLRYVMTERGAERVR
jgi:DNA replication protein DnaC